MVCRCQGMPPSTNYVMMGLPPPAPNSTRQQLMQRWGSLISMSMSMGVFDVGRWYQDNAQLLFASMQAKSLQLKELIQDYIQALETDHTLPVLAKALGGVGPNSLTNKSKAKQIQAVGSEAKASMDIFLAGDWACLTYIGAMLMQNAFQTSDPRRYRLDDVHLKTIFENGIGLLISILGRGYSAAGWRLALEMDRPPITPGTTTKSATKRLEFYAEL